MAEQTGTDDLVIERTFDAPIEAIWQMWTSPEHFKRWYGPTGATIPVAEMDVRVGGRRRLGMEMATPNGQMQMWFVGTFVDVTEPTRLAFTEAVANADGTVMTAAQMGMPEGHPMETEVQVDLEDLGDGRTRMTMTHVGISADSPGAGGWAMSFDKLAAKLATD